MKGNVIDIKRVEMAKGSIQCADCQSVDAIERGRSAAGKQRYCCRN